MVTMEHVPGIVLRLDVLRFAEPRWIIAADGAWLSAKVHSTSKNCPCYFEAKFCESL